MALAVHALLSALVLAGADAAVQDDEPRCVQVRGINGYSVLDDRHLLLRGGASRYYLVTTRTRCSGLRFGASVGLSFADTARICPPITEYLIPDDGWRCRISEIVEVQDEDAARARIAEQAEADAAEDEGQDSR
ncbi:MAG: DUF6491 family protein [Alphaproteobacteria bacterium]|nr:DUF6491 family protein [Alphaproteobacteria bacterium]